MELKIPAAVTSRVARQILITQKHSPTILFAVGVVGMAATVVTACRATLKVDDVLVDAQKDIGRVKEHASLQTNQYTERDAKKDLTVVYIRSSAKVLKLYAPSIIIGVASIAALTGSHRILMSRNTGLIAAYSALQRGFDQYRARVIDEYGEEKDRELRYGTEMVTVTSEDKNGPKKTKQKQLSSQNGSMYARFFDPNNQNWETNPDYNLMFLRSQMNFLNDRLRTRGHVFLNEAYDALGFEHSKAGAVTGWLYGKGKGDQAIDFGIFDDASMTRFHDWITGRESGIWIDFNVDGVIYEDI